MTIHITNIHGMNRTSIAQKAQNQVAQIACRELGFREIGMYFYDSSNEPQTALQSRFDGMIASLADNDTVIFQSPSWNSIEWDRGLMNRISLYAGVKKIVFIEDVVPLMFPSNYYLMPKFIEYYNRADVLIAPSPQLIDRLKQEGLADRPVVYQQFWDHLVMEDFSTVIPSNTHRLNFAGNPAET